MDGIILEISMVYLVPGFFYIKLPKLSCLYFEETLKVSTAGAQC